MDVEGFASALARSVAQAGAVPGEPRELAEAICSDVPGMSTEHALVVLRLAVEHAGDGELYLEVGSYRGRSLVGALAGTGGRGVAIENFSEFPEPPSEARAQLLAALARWDIADRVDVRDGDAFRLLGDLSLPAPVAVYFYDGVHSSWAQFASLGLAEHLLADRAVVLVDDASWPQVGAALDAYTTRHPGYELIADFRASRQEDPVWCNGLRVYAWSRPPGWTPRLGRDVLVRAGLQRHVDAPLRTLAWRTLSRHPRAFNAVRRVVTRGRTQVADSGAGADG